MESDSDSQSSNNRSVPLSDVVADCIKRWFKDTLRKAKSGDVSMQVLGRLWMTRASRVRSSAWKVSDKRKGYNASDSDSDELGIES